MKSDPRAVLKFGLAAKKLNSIAKPGTKVTANAINKFATSSESPTQGIRLTIILRRIFLEFVR